MKLYGISLSPYVRKVLMVAAEKGLELEVVPVGLGQPNPDFLACSPFAKMPGFEDGDFRISDSTAIVTYLDARYPEPPMYPSTPEDRARAVWFEELADTIFVAVGGKIFFNRVVAKLIGREGDLAAADKAAAEELPPVYDYLEKVVPEASGFLVGNRLSIADIAVASPFVNMMHTGTMPDPARYPRLSAWARSWLERPGVAALLEREQAIVRRAA
ncbi:glutathione S-transferase family protein [Sphingomonas sp.]|jgi:glutathione S-transferase|uniref:glutathione S-transferase family protein n=1 Tax=Sphingomonas sp. TaxID=28214 RepID=UPI002DEA52FF|nr:glutathione S-transferase family protein [Sphingomonas sp.]